MLSDEIYGGLVYDGHEALSIATLPGMQARTIIVDGFSKTYAMTGWRLGYGIMPVELARRMDLLLTHSVGSTAHFTQIAGIEALDGFAEAAPIGMRAGIPAPSGYDRGGAAKHPRGHVPVPAGAFYVFPNVKAFGRTSGELTDLLLDEAGVAVLPGSAFGEHGEGYLRLSYATSPEHIREGLRADAEHPGTRLAFHPRR